MHICILALYANCLLGLRIRVAIIYTLTFFYRFMPTKQACHKENRGGCIQHDEAFLLSI